MKQNRCLYVAGIYLLFMVLSFLSISNTAMAEIKLFTLDKNTSISASGEITARNTYENWFEPALPNLEHSYDYFFTRSRLAIALRNPYIGAYVQAQHVYMWNLPENSIAPSPQGPMGSGAIYYMHARSDTDHSLIIRQAYLDFPKLFLKGLSVRIGRFDYADGQEVIYKKNAKVTWLKNARLSDRMIGAFDWSAYNRSFDGLQAAYDGKVFNLFASVTHPTQGGFENNAQKTISAIDLGNITGTMKYGELLKNTEVRAFYYYYNDHRNIPSILGESGLKEGNIRINTFGTHWLHTENIKSGVFDVLFWGALQEGEWGAVDHRAWAATIEGGFQFTNVLFKPWIRGGYFASSGDSNLNDGKHGTFYQMLPTARKYAFFPFYNLMNNEDLFVQAIVKPTEALSIRADLHSLSLQNKQDLWYMGAGPTQGSGSIFGYLGRPSNNHDGLATVLDISPGYTFSKYLSANLYYGHAFGKDVLKSIYKSNSNGDLFYVELKTQF
jgi:hypothetical protein